MNVNNKQKARDLISDIEFDLIDLNKGEIKECYENQQDLINDILGRLDYLHQIATFDDNNFTYIKGDK